MQGGRYGSENSKIIWETDLMLKYIFLGKKDSFYKILQSLNPELINNNDKETDTIKG
jgi:hypothetical protein